MKENQYENLIKPIIEIYDNIELELLKNIASRFDTYDIVGGTLDWYLKKLEDMGALTKSNLKIIASKSKLSQKEIEKLMKDVGYNITHIEDFKKAFDNNTINISPNDLYKSTAIQNVIRNSTNYSADILKLVNTKALESSTKAYMDVLNKAYIETSSGVYSYNESIKKALMSMANNGIKGATYLRQGKIVNYSLEGTVRRDILTKTRQTANEISLAIDDELGNDLVYITQHYGARPQHAIWQGKVYSKSGTSNKYPDLIKSTGYGTITGLGGVNCRHFIQSFVEGITEIPTQLDIEENERIYNLTQEQRGYERNVRKNKKELAIAKTLDDKELIGIQKKNLNESQSKLLDFANNHKELRMDYSRTQVYTSSSNKNTVSILNKGTELDRNYLDIKEDWLKKAKLNENSNSRVLIPKIGDSFNYKDNSYIIDNKNVVLDYSEQEESVANWLKNTFNENVNIVPRINYPESMGTPDYIFKSEGWDLKSIVGNSKQTIYHNIYKKNRQSSNFIIDISNSKLTYNEVLEQINQIYKRPDVKFVVKLIIKRDNEILNIFKRK